MELVIIKGKKAPAYQSVEDLDEVDNSVARV